MRADRLVAVLLLLQARGRATAADLAAELEVSVATARRDLDALSTAGVPVYPQAGRGGGWSLVGGARTDLSGLTAREARALFLLAGPAARASDEVKTALRKLTQALPATFRADAEAAAQAVVVDPSGWGSREPERPELVGVLEDAVVRRRKVRLRYAGRTGAPGERLIDPWGLIQKDDIWYLMAGTERGQRTFRVDRIVSAVATEAASSRPDGFGLAAAWQQVVDEMEERRSRTWAVVLVEARFVPVLRDRFGLHFQDAGVAADGRARARVAAPTPRDVAQNLAGWGGLIEVLSPSAVRAELARIGAELTGRYA